MPNKRTYLDPIHHEIVLDQSKPEEKLIVDLIDTPAFQRLRRIHQLGDVFFTFHGAEGSRFAHSLGVMHIASQLVSLLAEKCSLVKELKPLILATALLHDIGHGPFSHESEKIFDYNHEDWSCKIIANDSEIRAILDNYDKSLSQKIVKVLKKEFSPKFVSHIVSSQLDCDRFDYLLRDSYMTGTYYGVFALQRILSAMEVDEVNDCIIIDGEKGQIAVEDYLFSRYSMYAQVYYHKKNLASRVLLRMLIKRARELGPKLNFIDSLTQKLLDGEALSVAQYLMLDDIHLTYHIKQWALDKDAILADLASRYLHRRIFRAMKIPSKMPIKSNDLVEAIAKRATKIVKDLGMDPQYYVTIESAEFRPYDYYHPDALHPQTSIMVRTESGAVKELSDISVPIAALAKENFETSWLVFPEEASSKIDSIKELTT
jgi:HD superfamily phosphohydrolase